MLGVISCRKEDVIIDREDNLSQDTALIIYQVQYSSHTGGDVNFLVDMLQLNGTTSEATYAGHDFQDPGTTGTVSFGNPNPNVNPSNGSYSTILVFDYAETWSYEENFVGYYLRRFFEIADSLPNRNVALSSFSGSDNTPTRLHAEDHSNIFGNSWEYSISQFYAYTTHLDDDASATNGAFLKSRMIGLIDSLIAAPQASGDLSITLIAGYGGYYFSNYADLDAIIDHALANNVKINIISQGGSSELTQMANETGGFLSTWIPDINGNPYHEDHPYSNTQITLQNLDELLMGNVTTHRVMVTHTKDGTGMWQSPENAYTEFIYKDHRLNVQFRIP